MKKAEKILKDAVEEIFIALGALANYHRKKRNTMVRESRRKNR